MSVYEDFNTKVLVFHSDWSANWHEYLIWNNRAWIFNRMEAQIIHQWTHNVQEPLKPEEADRRGSEWNEKQDRCAFKDVKVEPMGGKLEEMASRFNLRADQVAVTGYWGLVKQMIRYEGVLPESRDRKAELAQTIYLTGAGFGGVWAALSSMHFKLRDDAEYATYLIAAQGFQCLARHISADMRPWEEHTQIKSYHHVIDAYAGMDYPIGEVCYYGFKNLTAKDDPVHKYCAGMVGFTGPQLLYRGDPFGNYLDSEGEIDMAINDPIRIGRKNFDA